jgi:hypothetical protein
MKIRRQIARLRRNAASRLPAKHYTVQLYAVVFNVFFITAGAGAAVRLTRRLPYRFTAN